MDKRKDPAQTLTSDNVILSSDKIDVTPSMADGMDPAMEWEARVVGCDLISSAGILLKLPQTAMATGQVLFHRFYYTKSLIRQDMEHTAMACIYLASKIEEAPRRIRDVINVFHHLHQLRTPDRVVEPMILDQTYIQLKSDVTLAERRILKELGFCVHVKHPHKLIVVYLQQLGYDRNSEFVQMSWNYMSDSLRTNVFVRYRPEAIACACVSLSSRKLKIPLPANPPWFVVFDVEEEQIVDICESILELYERGKIDYDGFLKKYKAIKKTFKESKEKTKEVKEVAAVGGTAADEDNNAVKTAPAVPPPLMTEDQQSTTNKDTAGQNVEGSSSPHPPSRKERNDDDEDDGGQKHSKKRRRKERSRSRSRSRDRDRVGSRKTYSRKKRGDSRGRSHSHSPKRSRSRKAVRSSKEGGGAGGGRSRSRSHSPTQSTMEREDSRYRKGGISKSSGGGGRGNR